MRKYSSKKLLTKLNTTLFKSPINMNCEQDCSWCLKKRCLIHLYSNTSTILTKYDRGSQTTESQKPCQSVWEQWWLIYFPLTWYMVILSWTHITCFCVIEINFNWLHFSSSKADIWNAFLISFIIWWCQCFDFFYLKCIFDYILLVCKTFFIGNLS